MIEEETVRADLAAFFVFIADFRRLLDHKMPIRAYNPMLGKPTGGQGWIGTVAIACGEFPSLR